MPCVEQPRVREEDRDFHSGASSPSGTAPRARGGPGDGLPHGDPVGNSPACAGTTLLYRDDTCGYGDSGSLLALMGTIDQVLSAG